MNTPMPRRGRPDESPQQIRRPMRGDHPDLGVDLELVEDRRRTLGDLDVRPAPDDDPDTVHDASFTKPLPGGERPTAWAAGSRAGRTSPTIQPPLPSW
jgi:hypothetical protein